MCCAVCVITNCFLLPDVHVGVCYMETSPTSPLLLCHHLLPAASFTLFSVLILLFLLHPACFLVRVCVCVCGQMAHLVQVKSHGLSGSQSLYDPHGVSSASPSPSRPPMPRQNSDPTSDTPPPPPLSRLVPPLDKLDRSSWLRQDDDMPPKVSACNHACIISCLVCVCVGFGAY